MNIVRIVVGLTTQKTAVIRPAELTN